MRLLQAARAGFKAQSAGGEGGHRFPGTSSTWTLYGPRTAIDYHREIGNPLDNSIVASCIRWKSTNWTQASPVVKRTRRLTEPANEFDHELVKLLARPNPHYSSRLLREALLQDFELDGTAFIRVIFDRYNLPTALYWLPTDAMSPIYNADGSEWVRYWEYTVGGQVVKLDPQEVIVWKQGVDRASGGRRGYSPFRAGIAEVYSDNEARNTVNAILRNRAQMGMMVSPDGRYFAELVKGGVKPYEAGYNAAQAQEIEARVNSKNSGDRRGSTNVFSVPMTITEFGSVLDKLDSRTLRSFSEERLCALFGLHPVVLPMGTGLEASSDKHNMETAQRMSWLNGIVPLQDSFADAVNELIPLMDARPDTARFDFDRSQVEALQENADDLSSRIMAQWKDDAITHDELRGRLGYKTDEARKGKYYSELVKAGDPMADNPTQEEDGIKALLRRRRSLELVAEL